MATSLWFVLLLGLIAAHRGEGCSLQLPSNYDKNQAPGPVSVKVGLYLGELIYDRKSQGMKANGLILRQNWRDPRLDSLVTGSGWVRLPLDLKDRIWTPDTYFRNTRSVEARTAPSTEMLLRVKADGEVYLVQSLNAEFICLNEEGLFRYPSCDMIVESYGYDNNTVSYQWSGSVGVSNKNLANYDLRNTTLLDCSATYTAGTFSCIKARFNFARKARTNADRDEMTGRMSREVFV